MSRSVARAILITGTMVFAIIFEVSSIQAGKWWMLPLVIVSVIVIYLFISAAIVYFDE